jgi:hypothetical protein
MPWSDLKWDKYFNLNFCISRRLSIGNLSDLALPSPAYRDAHAARGFTSLSSLAPNASAAVSSS